MDIIIGGMPRGGTTLAAKFFSLHEDIFCYAGETHVIPLIHGLLRHFPCVPRRKEEVVGYLRHEFMTAMVAMPRYSVSKGAHPANLIFDENKVEWLLSRLSTMLGRKLFGEEAHLFCMNLLRELLAECDRRPVLGEKTPSNIFAMAAHGAATSTLPVVVVREPFGVITSMRARIATGVEHSAVFGGDVEHNIGMYLEYAEAALQCMSESRALLVRYEDMANDPAAVLSSMYGALSRTPEERVIRFVEKGGDKTIADRAPMNYKRLAVRCNQNNYAPDELWRIAVLTARVRTSLGYDDAMLSSMGYELQEFFPPPVPAPMVVPLSGFYPDSGQGACWMSERGALVAYFPERSRNEISLKFWSCFPAGMLPFGIVNLRILVGGVVREELSVREGEQLSSVCLFVSADEMSPMANGAGWVRIDLHSSAVFSPLAQTDTGGDTRSISFLLAEANAKKKPGTIHVLRSFYDTIAGA